jgi:hypothetical protein
MQPRLDPCPTRTRTARPARNARNARSVLALAAAAGAVLALGGAALPASAAPAVSATPNAPVTAPAWDPDQKVRISSATLDEASGEIAVDLTIVCQQGLAATVEVLIAQTVDEDFRLAHGEGERDGLTCTGEPLTTTVVATATSKTAFVVGDALIGARLETAVDVSTHARQTPVTATP